MHALKTGDRVQVVGCSGLDSFKTGVIVSRKEVPLKQTGGGMIPNLPGYYRPMNGSEVAIRCNNGELITMFRNRLRLMS